MLSARSNNLITAFRTELGSGFVGRVATPALIFRPQRGAALGTEFASLGAGAAGRAKGDSLAGEIEIFREVLMANFFFHLIDRRLHLRRGDFGLDIGAQA